MELHEQPDWQRTLGQHVEIRLRGETIRTGTVEAVMPDDSILWLAADGPFSREMVERADGYKVFARYEWNVARKTPRLPPSAGVTARVALPPA